MSCRFVRRSLPLAAVAAALFNPYGLAGAQQPADPAKMKIFLDDLMIKMSLEEKIGQMEQAPGFAQPAGPGATPTISPEDLARQGKVGSFLFLTDTKRINELQRIATTESPHHIPLLFGYDVIHGYRTIYPIPLALASSWDADLATRVQTMAAREARSAGIHWAFAPMVDIARDARWGRIMEGAGEDPYLGEVMAAAQVRGFQGPYVGAPDHILASVKHFAGYGAAVGGRDYDSSDISDDLLYNVYLRPYHAGVEAGTATIMSAYMDLNSVPATGNTWLMRDVLRRDWGFKGFVVSDWDAIKSLTVHGFAADAGDAAERAADAGINMEMTSSTYREALPALVNTGKVSPATVDALVRPILEMKYRLGLFSNAQVDVKRFEAAQVAPAQRAASRDAARQTAVLLRNEGGVLPLKPGVGSIALLGPLADAKLDSLGSWAIHADRRDTVTIAEGLREALPNTRIDLTTGVEIKRFTTSIFDGQVPPEKLVLTTDAARTQEFDHALELARKADVAVMVLGELQGMSGERAARATLELPGEQERLLEAVVGLGKPVVLVVMTGRPLDITWASTHVPAILNVWYPGTEAGHAVADLLLGKANPSGHLPLTWPRNAGQEPLFYNTNLTQIPEDRQERYWDTLSTPLYPFGFGLSYSSFTISSLAVNGSFTQASPAHVSVTVKNTSGVAGAQVVQLYTHQRFGSASRPRRELKAFAKVMLAPGESRQVALDLPASALRYWSPATHAWTLEPGTFDVWVGDSSEAELHTTVTLAGK